MKTSLRAVSRNIKSIKSSTDPLSHEVSLLSCSLLQTAQFTSTKVTQEVTCFIQKHLETQFEQPSPKFFSSSLFLVTESPVWDPNEQLSHQVDLDAVVVLPLTISRTNRSTGLAVRHHQKRYYLHKGSQSQPGFFLPEAQETDCPRVGSILINTRTGYFQLSGRYKIKDFEDAGYYTQILDSQTQERIKQLLEGKGLKLANCYWDDLMKLSRANKQKEAAPYRLEEEPVGYSNDAISVPTPDSPISNVWGAAETIDWGPELEDYNFPYQSYSPEPDSDVCLKNSTTSL